MKVCVNPHGGLSRAMHRISDALAHYAPKEIEIVRFPHQADLQVIHMIGRDCMNELRAPNYALIHYCGTVRYDGAGKLVPVPAAEWSDLWEGARMVWSYYDLPVSRNTNFYFAPLGVDGNIFKFPKPHNHSAGWSSERDLVCSSGFVSGKGAEAIEEVAIAATAFGMSVVHIGPPTIVGMSQYPKRWSAILNIPDESLAHIYQRSLWVSGLRYMEGFELPVLEGLMCGARPIVFDRPDMRLWYDQHAVFVPESDGSELLGYLAEVFQDRPQMVSEGERAQIEAKFDWKTVATGFWNQLVNAEARV